MASVRFLLSAHFVARTVADIAGTCETHTTETRIDRVELVALSYLSLFTLAYLSWPEVSVLTALVMMVIRPDYRSRPTPRPRWHGLDKGGIVTVHRRISAGRHSLLHSDSRGRVFRP